MQTRVDFGGFVSVQVDPARVLKRARADKVDVATAADDVIDRLIREELEDLVDAALQQSILDAPGEFKYTDDDKLIAAVRAEATK